jgi:hypothetical protein
VSKNHTIHLNPAGINERVWTSIKEVGVGGSLDQRHVLFFVELTSGSYNMSALKTGQVHHGAPECGIVTDGTRCPTGYRNLKQIGWEMMALDETWLTFCTFSVSI